MPKFEISPPPPSNNPPPKIHLAIKPPGVYSRIYGIKES